MPDLEGDNRGEGPLRYRFRIRLADGRELTSGVIEVRASSAPVAPGKGARSPAKSGKDVTSAVQLLGNPT
jgi:hypothetical protein